MIKVKGIGKKDHHLITLDSLFFIMSHGNYIRLYYIDGNTLYNKTLRCTLKSILNQLKEYPQIVKCNKSFLVNLNNVFRHKNFYITNEFEIKIPISNKIILNL